MLTFTGIFHLTEPVALNRLFVNARLRHKKDVAATATANQNGSVSADSVKSSYEEVRVNLSMTNLGGFDQ